MPNKLKGSIEKLPSGKYRLRVTVGYNEKGNPIREFKIVDVSNQRKAYAELDKYISELEAHGYIDISKITFKNFYDKNWKNDAVDLLEPHTYYDYISIIDQRFLKPLGNKKLQEIKPFEIQDIINKAERLDNKTNPLSRKTKKKYLNSLSSVFSLAQNSYQIINENPANKVKLKKEKNASPNTKEPYSLHEIDLLLQSINHPATPLHTKALLLTAFITGAREGEIAALEESDFDFENQQVTFHQRITKKKNDKNKWEYYRLDGTKTGTSITMSVPEDYLSVIKELIKERKENRLALMVRPDHNYIFGSADGKFMLPTSIYRKWIRFAERHELRVIRFHDLRHTTASFLIANPDIPLKVVQERLGHKDYRTTMNMYASVLEESDRKASDAFDTVLSKEIK